MYRYACVISMPFSAAVGHLSDCSVPPQAAAYIAIDLIVVIIAILLIVVIMALMAVERMQHPALPQASCLARV